MPLLSFIIPYHNESVDLLHECIDSIKALQLAEGEQEIIVVDDGSEVSLENELTSCYPGLVYVSQENAGLSTARNHGLSIAKGKYIQFVDADDYLIADAYTKVICKVRQQTADIVMFRLTRREKSKHKFPPTICTSGVDYLNSYNLRAAACGYVFCRDILDGLLFEHGIYHEDELFTPLLLLRAKRVEDIGQNAYFYRQRIGSIMTSQSREHISKRLDDMLYVLQCLSAEKQQLDREKFHAFDRRIAQLTMDYLYNIIRLTHDWRELRVRSAQLKEQGLLPLPVRFYTLKYWLFTHIPF